MVLLLLSIAVVVLQVGAKGELSPVLAGLTMVVMMAVLAGGVRAGARPSVLASALRPALTLISVIGVLSLVGGDAKEMRQFSGLLLILGFLIFIFWRVLLGNPPRER